MTKFIVWPKEQDAPFRPAYAETVQELIQANPAESATHFMAGSSRITNAQAETLTALFPDLTITDEFPPEFEGV